MSPITAQARVAMLRARHTRKRRVADMSTGPRCLIDATPARWLGVKADVPDYAYVKPDTIDVDPDGFIWARSATCTHEHRDADTLALELAARDRYERAAEHQRRAAWLWAKRQESGHLRVVEDEATKVPLSAHWQVNVWVRMSA